MVAVVAAFFVQNYELVNKDYAYAQPSIEKQPWGEESSVIDPFGNRLTFYERE